MCPGGLLASVVSWLGIVQLTLVVLIAIFTLIPGMEPEQSLQKILDLIRRVSKK